VVPSRIPNALEHEFVGVFTSQIVNLENLRLAAARQGTRYLPPSTISFSHRSVLFRAILLQSRFAAALRAGWE
jgi:hypothetical protein